MAIKRCTSSFATSVRGVPRVMKTGTLVNDDDPILEGREHLFEDVEAAVRQAPVEDASATPGRRRSLTRAAVKRTGAKTAAVKPKTAPAKTAAAPAKTEPKAETGSAGSQNADTQTEGATS